MSIEHLVRVAELEMHSTKKLVFMALADDANKLTRRAFPGMPKLMEWSGAKQRRVQDILEELVSENYLAHWQAGMPGKNAEFIIFPTPEEQAAAKARGEARAAKKAAKKSGRQPVDNSQKMGAFQRNCANGNGCNPSSNACTPECTPPLINPQELSNSSSKSTHVSGAVDNSKSDDEKNFSLNIPTPATVIRHVADALDVAQVAASVGRVFADTGITNDGLEALCYRILDRASSRVMNKTLYVVTAIRRDTHEWVAQAYEIAAEFDAYAKRATR